MRFELGLVIGKFYPPHRGHKLLIDTALKQSQRTVVIVCGKASDSIPGELRGQWLQQIHPSAEVMVIDDRYDENDSQVWAENTIRWLGRAPDAVFTSEDYGDRYCQLMGSHHVSVDRARRQVPISGTAIRRDPFANWKFLEPPVRGSFAKRVCVLGAESTGTTTLAKALAEHFQTRWVAEFGRDYSANKSTRNDVVWKTEEFVHIAEQQTCWVAEFGRDYSANKSARNDLVWKTEEFVHIAEQQTRMENRAACEANRLLICDTNAFATVLWHRRYMNFHSKLVEDIAKRGRCDLYLLTGDEIPFVQDGLRDGEHIRHEMHRWFEEALEAQPVPWAVLRGSPEQRLTEASRRIRELFKEFAWKPDGKIES